LQTTSKGIATAALAVVVIVVVAVAGAAAYFALSSGSSNTSSSSSASSTNTMTTSASSSATSTLPPSSTTSTTLPSSTTTQVSSSTVVSSSSQTSSTVTSVSSFSCSTTYSNNTGQQVDYTPQYIGLISKYSQITFTVEGSYNGTKDQNSTFSYQSTVVSSGIYDVNITFASSGSTESGLARVDSNNASVISVTFSGYTFSGPQAKSFFDGLFALFGLEYTYGGYEGILTNSGYFHSTGSQQMTFGQTSFSVTTWVANSLPLSVNQCGYSADLTAYTLQVGSPPGSSLNFITYLHLASDSPTAEDFTFQLVSMTQA